MPKDSCSMLKVNKFRHQHILAAAMQDGMFNVHTIFYMARVMTSVVHARNIPSRSGIRDKQNVVAKISVTTGSSRTFASIYKLPWQHVYPYCPLFPGITRADMAHLTLHVCLLLSTCIALGYASGYIYEGPGKLPGKSSFYYILK